MINTVVILICWGLFILGVLFFLNFAAGEPKRRTFGIFFLFLVFLSLVYSPSITGHYIFHDDVFMWLWNKNSWVTHPQYHTYELCFRPLERMMALSLGGLLDHVNDANIVRFITVIIISLVALAVDIWLRQVCGTSKRDSFLTSLAIVVLPPFQVYVFWMITGNMAIAILLAACAAMLLLKRQDYWAIFFSLFLLLGALLTYQPSATFFVALLGIWLIRMDCKNTSKIIWPWLHLVIFFIAAGIDLLFFKILVPANAMGAGSLYNNSLTHDFAGKLGWFLKEPLMAALNLWHIFPSRAVAIGVLVIILFGITLELMGLMKSKNDHRSLFVQNFMKKYLAIVSLIVLSFSVNFANKENVFLYRTIAPLTAMILILFLSSIGTIITAFFKQERREALTTGVLFLICVYGMLTAHATLSKYCVDKNSRELRYVENEIASKYNASIRQIHLIRPPFPGRIGDEFGITTCFFSDDILGFVKAALQEKDFSTAMMPVVSTATANDVVPQDPGILIINLVRK